DPGGVPWVHRDDLADRVQALLVDEPVEGAPGSIVDGLTHPCALLVLGTRAGQTCHIQIVQGDDLVLVNQPAGEFVSAVVPSVADTGVDAGDFDALFMPVVGTFLFAGQGLLCPGESAFVGLRGAGVGDLFPGAIRTCDGRRIGEPEVYAGGGGRDWPGR